MICESTTKFAPFKLYRRMVVCTKNQMILMMMMMMMLTASGDTDFSRKEKKIRMNERNWIESSTF